MGLLDEAIRQHLELKRQHGASDEEVHLQEQEALGPVRREPAEGAAGHPDEAEPSVAPEQGVERAVEEPLEEEAPVEAAEDPLYEEAPVEAVEDPLYEDAPKEPAEDAPFEPDEAFLEPVDPYGEPGPEPATEALTPDQEMSAEPVGDTPPRGFEVVEEPAAENALPTDRENGEDEPEEDVLEETPEFLQETPEHDRLWFEQKPPRDFDFDE